MANVVADCFFRLCSKRLPGLAFFSIFFDSRPILFFVIVFIYLLLQLFNTEGTSPEGWFQIIRKLLAVFLILFIAYNVLNDLRKIGRFVKVLFVCCALTAFYGIFQQYHGLFELEEWWVRSNEVRFFLAYVHGNFRKFSVMSEPTGFRIIMAACALLFIIIGITERKLLNKAILFLTSLAMIMGMSFFGIRTAYLMLVGGVGLFILLTINKKATKIFAFFAVMAFLFLMYVPIYDNATLIRFRTSFSSTKNESYKVREVNHARIRLFLYSHPSGGEIVYNRITRREVQSWASISRLYA